MKQKVSASVIIGIFVVVLIGVGVYVTRNQQVTPPVVTSTIIPTPVPAPIATTTLPLPLVVPTPAPSPMACTQEAKQCSDGSYVGRTGKNCAFAQCPAIKPIPVSECTKDLDCPSSRYVCQATQGMGTACSSADASCVPTYTIIKGECKLKEGSGCTLNSDCVAGDLCHNNTCVSPIGMQCSGPSDTSCPLDYTCTQGCGGPVVRAGDPAPPYACQLNGYRRMCPICLAVGTLIDTPAGAVAVQRLQKGMSVWTITTSGERIAGTIIAAGKTPVPPTHQMVRLVLADGRTVLVSPGHPTIDGRNVGELAVNDRYDGTRVISVDRISYSGGATYDILPSGETGFYWANGILLDSTLH